VVDLPKKKATPKPKRSDYRVVKWLRAAGVAAQLLGWGGLMLADWFWVGAIFIYLGFLLLAVDVAFEPGFRGKWKQKWVIWISILIAAIVFTWGVVWVDGPLPIFAMATDGEYPSGTEIAGIKWIPEFTELNIDIENPKDRAYEDLNLLIRPNEAVAAIAQTSGISDVSFEDKNNLSFHVLDSNLDTGNSTAVPFELLATDAGYKVRCGRLGPHTHLKIVMAIADIKWDPSPKTPDIPIDQIVRDSREIIKYRFDDFSSYWFGHKEGDLYARRPSVKWMKVDGTYVLSHRRRTISKKITVAGNLLIKRQ
jgi:hypothetical protein